MPPDTQSIRRVALSALALSTLALGACANSPLLMPFPSGHAHPVKAQPAATAPNPGQLNEDLTLLQQWFDAPADAQSAQLEAAEADYQRTQAPREQLRLALLLAVPGTPSTDLPRAQELLKSLAQDPNHDLLPAERTLAQLALSLVAHQLTQSAESRTLQTGTVAKIAKLQAQLDAVTDQDVALRRQLEQARAKLAAIANIEKSLNEGKLGTPGPP
ncbi:MAG: hypothetical protein ACYCT1_12870 [Steroidobacteraceae bacterium]